MQFLKIFFKSKELLLKSKINKPEKSRALGISMWSLIQVLVELDIAKPQGFDKNSLLDLRA